MLVVTRRPNETIVFPNLGVTVRLLRVDGRVARIGVNAPPEVDVFRGEIAPAATPRSHAQRNRLNKVSLAFHLARRQCRAGLTDDAEATLAEALTHLAALDDSTPATPPRRVRALVVDDDDNERGLLAGLLRMNGCDCDTAADGQDALDYLAAHEPPDVVLLDMMMPRCDGPETLRRIRRDRRLATLRVFSVSGADPENLGVPTGAGGLDAWFPKPLDPEKLWDAIRLRETAAAN